jgi:oligopeptidase B
MVATPPIAARRPEALHAQGISLNDDYSWLRHKDDPAVIRYLEAENGYANDMLAHTADLQAQLYAEMRGRIKENDDSVPVRMGDYYYYTRTEEDKQYAIYCRKRGSLDAPEEILLDGNALAEGHVVFRVGAFKVSPDHNLLAYSIDTTGAIVFTLYIKDLRSGDMLDAPIAETASVEWAADNRTLFYTVYDESHRPYKLFRHRLGGDPGSDELLHRETDDAFYMGLSSSRSKRFIFLNLGSMSTSEVRYLPADEPDGNFATIHPRQHWMEYSVAHHGELFYIVTNDAGALNFKLMTAPVANPGKANWREMIAHRSDTLIESVDLFADYLIVYERQAVLQQIRISAPSGQDARYIAFPEPVYTAWPGQNEEFASDTLRLNYSSLVTPRSVIDYGLADSSWTVRKQDEIPSGYNPEEYVSERLTAIASDGAKIPLSIVYRKGLQRDGNNPTLLYGYGSYGYSSDPTFDSKRLSLLDRGFVYAIAHIRGGQELGRSWYEQGRLMHKKNSFSDFIACAEHLITLRYTRPQRIAIWGASAGGLLVTAVTNMRPDLFGAVVAKVPFTNVIAAITDPKLPLTVIEYEQWGSPHDPEAFAYMLSYSPYENLQKRVYPAILATGGLNDLQVPYWDPAKYVAKLRTLKTDSNPLLLRTNMSAGHGGASGRFDYLKEIAYEYAFVLDALGMLEG